MNTTRPKLVLKIVELTAHCDNGKTIVLCHAQHGIKQGPRSIKSFMRRSTERLGYSIVRFTRRNLWTRVDDPELRYSCRRPTSPAGDDEHTAHCTRLLLRKRLSRRRMEASQQEPKP